VEAKEGPGAVRELVDGGAPGEVDRVRVVRGAGLPALEEAGLVAAIEAEIAGEAERGVLGDVGGCRFEGEGEVAEFPSEFGGRGGLGGIGGEAGAAAEEVDGGFWLKDPDGAGLDAGRPGREAGGDEDVAVAGGGQPVLDGVLVLGVVEDEKAFEVGGLLQGGVGGAGALVEREGLSGVGVEVVPDGGEAGDEALAAIDPEEVAVGAPVGFGVVAGEGGFADAAEGGDGEDAAMGEGGGAGEEELLVKVDQGLVAADEVRGDGAVFEEGDAVRAVLGEAGQGNELADAAEEALPIFFGGLERVEGEELEAGEGRGANVLPGPADQEGEDGFRAVSLKAGPLGELPLGGEEGEDDAAGLAVALDLGVPVDAMLEIDLVPPDAEAGLGEAGMKEGGEVLVFRTIAQKTIVRFVRHWAEIPQYW